MVEGSSVIERGVLLVSTSTADRHGCLTLKGGVTMANKAQRRHCWLERMGRARE